MTPAKIEEMNEFLRTEIKERLRKFPQLQSVIVWVKEIRPVWNESTNSSMWNVYLGMALGSGTGCSPFCGCAANQLADQIGASLKRRFMDIRAVAGVAALPPDDIKEKWER